MGKVKSEGLPMAQVAGYEVSTDGGLTWEEAGKYDSVPLSIRRLSFDTSGYAPGQTTIIVRAVGVDGTTSVPITFSWVMPGVPAPSGLYFDPNDNS